MRRRTTRSPRFLAAVFALASALALLGGLTAGIGEHPATRADPAEGSHPTEPCTTFVGATAYAVTFTESGLPQGSAWSLTIGNSTSNASINSIVVFEPNGSYSYSAGSDAIPGGGTISGSFRVSGAATSVNVSFVPPPTAGAPGAAPTSSATGSPLGFLAGIGLAVVLTAGIALAVLRRRKAKDGISRPVESLGTAKAPDAGGARPSPATDGEDPLGHML